MRNIPTLALLLLGTGLMGQYNPNLPEFNLSPENLEMQMRFLAGDYLQGRRTGTAGNDIAAHFIAAHLEAYGYKPAPGREDFFQPIPFRAGQPPVSASMTINGKELRRREDFLIVAGPAVNLNGSGVFAGHGWVDPETGHDDYAGLDVAGKVVFVLPGEPNGKDPQSIFRAMRKKRELAEERGVIALVELYQMPFPWDNFVRYFGGESFRLDDEERPSSKVVYAWLNKNEGLPFEEIQTARRLRVELSTSGYRVRRVYSNNVCGVLEGTDPALKDEYMILSAHYDHMGAGEQGGRITERDSIFNGARDNAFGVVSMLAAAQALAEEKPRRSIIVLAVTAEEIGLLGSEYYVEHPLVPNEKVVFNLNTDGAGYNDTSIVSVFGWGRTGTNAAVEAGIAPSGLDIVTDPAPQMGIFDRSDNASFAAAGIPAMSISPGFREFEGDMITYYHQVVDEADSIDYQYLYRFCVGFAHTARQIANQEETPKWIEGDKYEPAAKELYGY